MKIESRIILNKFQPREYQLPILDAIVNKGYKRVLAILPRRAGKDLTAWNLCIREALKRVGTYYYVFPTYAQAKKVIWDASTIDGKRFINEYIPDELVASKNGQEMKIRFANGSLIQMVGSDNIDGLVGTNPLGVVFSEYAIQDPRAYNFLRPILMANDGWCVFISCVAPNTLVIGENGLQRISTVSDSREEYSDLNKKMWGLGGYHNAEQFYYGGKQKTYKITLESGFQLECTPVHPIWNGKEWVKSADLKPGDLLPIQYGQNKWGNGVDISGFSFGNHGLLNITMPGVVNRIDSDENFWYLLGLIHADGNYDKNKVTVTNKKDKEIISFLSREGFKPRKDGIHHELNSRLMCSFLEYLGFKHGALNKTFPDKMLSAKEWQLRSFLQGIFDGDGCSHARRGTIKLTSTCLQFMRDLQVLLLNFGIVSSLYREDKKPTKLVKVASVIYNLEITGVFAACFYRYIGFRLKRKQDNQLVLKANCYQEPANVYPVDMDRLKDYTLPSNKISNPQRISRRTIFKMNYKKPHPYLKELISEKFFYSPIKSIELSETEVYDFVIPETHSFFSNGFISHNTPRGKNHLWELWNIAQQNKKEWFSYKLTVEDTDHISLHEIEREKAQGLMSDDFIQQEFYCSFDMGVEGSYYAKYLDRMRVKGQIGIVPWESSFKVHTAWDIGVRDSTTIIFFQTVGQTVRIIDCYENSKVGLEHYIKILDQKPYQYGKHIAPHDIRVREFGTGMTRVEKARQLGINFTIAPDVSIEDGIESVRSCFSKVWIDEVACAPLLKSLENYRQEWDSKRKIYKGHPLHDFSSHFCFTADTNVLTRNGMRQIIDVTENDEVLTLHGWKQCTKAQRTQKNAKLVVVAFTDGTIVKCTPDHLFLTTNGWKSAENLVRNTRILSSLTNSLNTLMGLCTVYGQMRSIFLKAAKDCIERCGKTLLDQSQQIVMFITETLIPLTTISGTSNAFQLQSISNFQDQIIRDSLELLALRLPNGMDRMLESCGIKDTLKNISFGQNSIEEQNSAYIVNRSLKVLYENVGMSKNFATRTAKHLTIAAVQKTNSKEDVYDIGVPGIGHFSLSNGAIVHNCDSMRYLAISLPKTRDGLSAEELDKRYQEAIMGSNNVGMPAVFRTDLPEY